MAGRTRGAQRRRCVDGSRHGPSRCFSRPAAAAAAAAGRSRATCRRRWSSARRRRSRRSATRVSFSANAASPVAQLSLGLRRRQHQHRGRADPRLRARRRVRRPPHARRRRRLDVSGSTSVAVADFAIVTGKTCNGGGNNGWCWQRPLPQGNFILDYAFVDDSRGWAVGQGGAVLATVDGGVTWSGQHSGTTLDLSQAVFPNATAGWLTSEFGELLRTADGGATWRRVSYGRNDFVLALGASDADNAWVTTTLGAGFVTRDGGASWRQVARRRAAPSGSPSPAPPTSGRCRLSSTRSRRSAIRSMAARPGRRWRCRRSTAGFAGYSDDMLFVDAAACAGDRLRVGLSSLPIRPPSPAAGRCASPPTAAPRGRRV